MIREFLFDHYNLILLLMIILVSIAVFLPSASYFFFQDDWSVLNWVRSGNLISFFKFRQDIIYWRPLSMPTYFFLLHKIFGLNATAFHAVSYLFFIALIISTYILLTNITKNSKVSLIGTLLYSTWSIHFMSLSWLSTTSYIIVTLFLNLSFSFAIKFINNRSKKYYIISFTLFVLALLSHEIAIVLPGLIFSWGFILKSKNYFYMLLPYFLVSFLYSVLRIFIYPIPAKDSYQVHLSYLIINNFVWYIFWALNVPESFKEIINHRFLLLSLKRLTQFWVISIPVIVFTLATIKLFCKNYANNKKEYLFGLIWFCVGLLPIISITNHSYPVYLSLGGIGFVFILITALKNVSNEVLWLVLALWLISSLANLQFTRSTHWINNEQKISKAYYYFVSGNVKKPPRETSLLFKNPDLAFSYENKFLIRKDSDTLKQALNDQDFAQVIFDDNSIKSYYIQKGSSQIFTNENTIEISPTAQNDTNRY